MVQGLLDRKYWIQTLTKIVGPVLESGAKQTLKIDLPHGDEGKWRQTRKELYAHLEAVGRTLCGIAPWLESISKDNDENELREKFAILSRKTIESITNPNSPDCLRFYVSPEENGGNPYIQSLVDAAFLSHAILRAPNELFGKLSDEGKRNLISCLKETRGCKPAESNWLMFSAMVEAALFMMGEQPDYTRVQYAISKHESWYKGDGVYGDGPNFHFDFYNSYVIQPMLLDTFSVFEKQINEDSTISLNLDEVRKRARRYAEIQLRLIAPDGSFPVVGRSIAYRTGAFQLLAQCALQNNLPSTIMPAQVRSALTEVIHRCLDSKDNFDEKGWLQVGVCGNQPDLGEAYITVGSLYLCTTGFLTLGLDSDSIFWNSEYEDFPSRIIWNGKNYKADHSI